MGAKIRNLCDSLKFWTIHNFPAENAEIDGENAE